MASDFDRRRHALIRPAPFAFAKVRAENARLRRETSAFQIEREALQRIIGVTGRVAGREERLALLCAELRWAFRAPAAALYLHLAGGVGTRDAHFSGYLEPEIARPIALAQSPRALHAEEDLCNVGRAFIAQPANGLPARPAPDVDLTWRTLIVPLWYEGRLTGCLHLSRPETDAPFVTGDAALGDRLAATIGLVIARVEHEASVQRRANRAEALREIAHQLSAELDFERFFDNAAIHLMTLLNVRDCLFTAWDEAAQELRTLLYIGGGVRQTWGPPIRPSESRGLTTVVVNERRTLRVDNYLEECARRGLEPVLPEGDWGALVWVGVPLLARGQLVGVLVVERHGRSFDAEEVAILEALAGHLAAAMENVRLYAEVRQLALSDPLTGLTNHRHLHERLDQELGQAARHERPLAVVMLDLDDFKRYNDTYGHQVGDTLLRTFAAILRAEARAGDTIGRYGGDEFLLILPDTTRAEAAALLARIRSRLAAEHSPDATITGGTLTTSVGIATFPEDAREGNVLIARADAALYADKDARRSAASV